MAAARRKRRKKANESMERFKAPLIFAESPVEGSKHYCTPVQAARNPYMAPSVPVDELSMKWVSPHFPLNSVNPGLSPDCVFSRRSKRRKYKPDNGEKENPSTEQSVTRILMPTLEFENERRSAHKKTETRTKLRRSTRLKKKIRKAEHFLFGERDSHLIQIQNMKVLAPDTPNENSLPVVLQNLRSKTREIRGSCSIVAKNVCETPRCHR